MDNWQNESLRYGLAESTVTTNCPHKTYLPNTNRILHVLGSRIGFKGRQRREIHHIPALSVLWESEGTPGTHLRLTGSGAWGTWKIAKEVSDEKLARILQMMEYTHFDKDAYMRYFYGIEGIHYKWLGEPGKSSILTIPNEQVPEQYRSKAPMNIFASNKFLMDMSIWTLFSSYYYTWHFYQEENGWSKYDIEPYKYLDRMYFTDELWQQYEKVSQEVSEGINAVRNDFWNRAHEGQIANINQEWSVYIDNLHKNGLDKLVEIFNSKDMAEFLK